MNQPSMLLKQTAESWLLRFFRFFASVQLAVIMLLSLAAIMAVGTFVESAHGAKAAQILIYRSPWFSILLVLLAVNVVTSTLTRLPWKIKHIGFVVTHAGILMILAGSMITQRFAVDGMMAIREGESENHVTLGDSMLEVISNELHLNTLLPVKNHAFDWKGDEVLLQSENLNLHLLAFYPKAKLEETIVAADEGPAALQVRLEGAFMKDSFWLVEEDPDLSDLNLGIAHLRFVNQPLTDAADQAPYVELRLSGKIYQVPIAQATSAPFPLEGTPYRVQIQKVFLDAGVENGKLIERSKTPNNPACQLVLEGEDWTETHTLFSKYPEFPTMHGLKNSQTGAQMSYQFPSDRPKSLELRFLPGPEGELPRAQLVSGKLMDLEKLTFNKKYPTGWNDIQFQIETFYPHSKKKRSFIPLAVNSEEEGATTAIQLALVKNEDSFIFWLMEGEKQALSVNDKLVRIGFGRRTLPLGFSVFLKDFRVENYPGTNQPSSFESDATLEDTELKMKKEKTVSMNEPLEHRGFKIYQSGYSLGRGGEPDTSIFSVGRDPGIPLKYAGSIVMILGTIIFFFTKKFSTSKPLEIT